MGWFERTHTSLTGQALPNHDQVHVGHPGFLHAHQPIFILFITYIGVVMYHREATSLVSEAHRGRTTSIDSRRYTFPATHRDKLVLLASDDGPLDTVSRRPPPMVETATILPRCGSNKSSRVGQTSLSPGSFGIGISHRDLIPRQFLAPKKEDLRLMCCSVVSS